MSGAGSEGLGLEHKSPERVSEEAGAARAGEVLLGGLLAVL